MKILNDAKKYYASIANSEDRKRFRKKYGDPSIKIKELKWIDTKRGFIYAETDFGDIKGFPKTNGLYLFFMERSDFKIQEKEAIGKAACQAYYEKLVLNRFWKELTKSS